MQTIRGKPVAIVGSFEKAFCLEPHSKRRVRYDLVVLAVPAPFHDAYLIKLAPYLRQSAEADEKHASQFMDMPVRLPTILAAAVAQGGFDMAARAALADAGIEREVVVAGFETLPWACRVVRPGAVAEVLGTKDQVDAAVAVFPGTSRNLEVYAEPALQTLQVAVGSVPALRLASGFLGITLEHQRVLASHASVAQVARLGRDAG